MPRLCEMCPDGTAAAATVYCPADQCYLCAACDDAVHSANRLARRHVRRPLKPSPLSPVEDGSSMHDDSDALVPDVSAAAAAAIVTSKPPPPPSQPRPEVPSLSDVPVTFEDAADYGFCFDSIANRMPSLASTDDDSSLFADGKLGKSFYSDISWENVVPDSFEHVVPDMQPRVVSGGAGAGAGGGNATSAVGGIMGGKREDALSSQFVSITSPTAVSNNHLPSCDARLPAAKHEQLALQRVPSSMDELDMCTELSLSASDDAASRSPDAAPSPPRAGLVDESSRAVPSPPPPGVSVDEVVKVELHDLLDVDAAMADLDAAPATPSSVASPRTVDDADGASPAAAPANPASTTAAAAAGAATTGKPGAVTAATTSAAAAAAAAAVCEDDAHLLEQRKKRRMEALARFRSKRANRSFTKKVRYECRKQLADSRPRVKGRFVRKVEMALFRKYGALYKDHLDELHMSATDEQCVPSM